MLLSTNQNLLVTINDVYNGAPCEILKAVTLHFHKFHCYLFTLFKYSFCIQINTLHFLGTDFEDH